MHQPNERANTKQKKTITPDKLGFCLADNSSNQPLLVCDAAQSHASVQVYPESTALSLTLQSFTLEDRATPNTRYYGLAFKLAWNFGMDNELQVITHTLTHGSAHDHFSQQRHTRTHTYTHNHT